MAKIKTSISLDDVIYEKVKEISEQEERSFSQQVNKVLKEYLKSKEGN